MTESTHAQIELASQDIRDQRKSMWLATSSAKESCLDRCDRQLMSMCVGENFNADNLAEFISSEINNLYENHDAWYRNRTKNKSQDTLPTSIKLLDMALHCKEMNDPEVFSRVRTTDFNRYMVSRLCSVLDQLSPQEKELRETTWKCLSTLMKITKNSDLKLTDTVTEQLELAIKTGDTEYSSDIMRMMMDLREGGKPGQGSSATPKPTGVD